MTADTPAASKDGTPGISDDGMKLALAHGAKLDRQYEEGTLQAVGPTFTAIALFRHVATLTAKLEAERAAWAKDKAFYAQATFKVQYYARELEAARDAAVAEAKALREERDDWRAQYITARDALHPLTYPPDPITLRAIADEIDCGRDCESGYTEHDTNAFVCRKEERGECGWSKAEELRAFASAVEARRATLAQPADGGK